MKKVYIIPTTKAINLVSESIIAASGDGGVTTGSTTGNEFNEGDVSYTKGQSSLWDSWNN